MITEPLIGLEKRKISEFKNSSIGGKSSEELKKIFLGGYEVGNGVNTNVKVNLNDIILKGSGTSKAGTLLKDGLSDSASFDVDGYQKKTSGDKFAWTFDVMSTGPYIQIENISDESLTEESVNDTLVKVLDVAFINAELGATIKLYLPDFGPHNGGLASQYAVRVWQRDPKSQAIPTDNPFDCNPVGYYAFVTKPIDKTEAKSYDWMLCFVELAAGMDGSSIVRGTRVNEVLNIFDNDDFDKLENLI